MLCWTKARGTVAYHILSLLPFEPVSFQLVPHTQGIHLPCSSGTGQSGGYHDMDPSRPVGSLRALESGCLILEA